ncbi:low temperature requirement protein A [Cryobacterium sp. PH31-AA6]|uniref:low temperature requirement protein A n=1 Tax=Cryobacterium sp. PH31-AA6 TaxID=3046205 RepID=UPI0024B8939F|nr:low temperature requirement protein A [Cryobacterium sp. PH31-AA6]MDJ0322665.1 low temperature requirement protein A [Cryobacterium sp. PH31-AA6]
MTGRNPREVNRAATPLELLFDLSFVVALGVAADQFAYLVAARHFGEGLLGFAFAMLAICWAWINFSWFSSAYDTDDWFYRLATMVQMVGVIVLALGLPALFHSLDEGAHVDSRVVVAGYVVMRVALITQWLRVSAQDPVRRLTSLTYAGWVGLAQVGWVVLSIIDLALVPTVALAAVLFIVEFTGPVIAERRIGGTPWHPLHIAERYGLFAIIALGEGVFGTVTTVSAIVQRQSWSAESIIIIIAGMGLTFGMWWTYFLLPSGTLLAHRRGKRFVWGYGHILVYTSIAAMGAGLHVAAYVIEGETALGTLGAILAVSIPVAIYSIALFALYYYLLEEWDPLHVVLLIGAILVLVIAAGLAVAGASLGLCLIIVTLSPAVVVVGFETAGHRHQAAALGRLEAPDTAS